jgi:hypothetical protein
MSQNQVARYLNQASDFVDLLYRDLDLLTFTANACNTYDVKDVARLHHMLEIFHSHTEGTYDELKATIRKLKRELKAESQSYQALQPQENNPTP